MRRGQLCSELSLHLLGQLLQEILAKIKTNPDAVDADEIDHVLDMIDITIDGARFRSWSKKAWIYSENTAALPDDLDLLVADVALGVIERAHVSVRIGEQFVRELEIG